VVAVHSHTKAPVQALLAVIMVAEVLDLLGHLLAVLALAVL
jgi:hypothetical protein